MADITEAFKHTDVVVLQQKLNEVLIRKTDFNANWRCDRKLGDGGKLLGCLKKFDSIEMI